MRKFLAMGLVCVLSIGLAGCGKKEDGNNKDKGSTEVEIKTHEDAVKAQIDAMQKLVDIVDGIETKEDVQTASAKIDALVEDMKKLDAKMKELGKPSKELDAELKKKYMPQMKEIAAKMFPAMFKLAKIEGGKELLKKLQSLEIK